MSIIRFLFAIGIFIALYFAFQYMAHPDDFKTPTDLIQQLQQKDIGVKNLEIIINDSRFSRNEINIAKGINASIDFKSLDATYKISAEQLGFLLDVIPKQDNFMKFTADTTGEFIITCLSPCNGDVLGKIVVR